MVLHSKTALVTGASRGIGRATALALAETGAHVLVHYGRSAQEAESLVAEIKFNRGRAETVSADLSTPDGASLVAKQVRSIVGDRLDILVLNAGVSKAARLADYTVDVPTYRRDGDHPTDDLLVHVRPFDRLVSSATLRRHPGAAARPFGQISGKWHPAPGQRRACSPRGRPASAGRSSPVT